MQSRDQAAEAARIEAALSAEARPTQRPYLVMMSGLPGTGKSTLCRGIQEQLPVVIVESDAVRSTLYPYPTFAPTESAHVFAVCFQVMERLLQRKVSVVFDATNVQEKHREPMYQLAERCGVPLVILRVDAREEVVRKRLEERAASVGDRRPYLADWQVYLRMAYARERIRRKHMVVDTSGDIQQAIKTAVATIREVVDQWWARATAGQE